MTDTLTARTTRGSARAGLLDRGATAAVMRQLESLATGSVTLVQGGSSRRFGPGSEPAATIRVEHPSFFTDVALGGAIGAAEAYARGSWSADDLTAVVRVMLRNREVLERLESGPAVVARPLRRAAHWLRRNSPSGSRRNISAHYDLGNEFFALWLDRRMMYSSAVYERPDQTLDDAALAKLDLICKKLALGPEDHVLEIGTGWGGFAIHAASRYGCRVTTTTISREQFRYATEAVARQGVADRVTLLLEDYRDLEGQYDKLVSIEMMEAVGHEYHPAYLRKCMRLLKPEGRMLLQTITIADQRYERYRRSVDFIKRYIFPGGCLPSVTRVLDVMTRHTDFRLCAMEDYAASYARTLATWRDGFNEHIATIRAQGYPEEFLRLWRFYLCYCEAAFTERATGVVQLLLARPRAS